MNERIRELALQVDLMRYKSDGINIKIEKLAELIVKECANYLENEYGKSVITGNDAADLIRKYFSGLPNVDY